MVISKTKKLYIPKLQAYELYKLMYHVHNLFMKFGIQYSIEGGTLLGAIRHKGIIPWDNDIDILTNYKNYKIIESKEFKSAAKKYNICVKLHNEGWLKIKATNGKYKVDIDIFPITIRNNKVTLYGNAGKIWPKNKWEINNFFPLKKYKFGALQVLGPNKPKKILFKSFGKNVLKVAYLTQDPKTHYDYTEPIKINITKFVPAKKFYNPKKKQDFIKNKLFYSKEYFNKCSGKLNCMVQN